MKTSRFFLIFFLLTSFSLLVSGQQKTVTGKVSGIDGYLIGAEVSIVHSKTKVQTDINGQYTIEMPVDNQYLLFKYKSMKQTIKVDIDCNLVNVTLIPSEKELYKMAISEKQIRLCDIYLNNYTDGKNKDEITQLKEKCIFIEAYNSAASQFSDTALRNYIHLYPTGAYLQKANDAIEIAVWQKARFENTTDSYTNYLNLYPNGKAVQLAKEKIASLK